MTNDNSSADAFPEHTVEESDGLDQVPAKFRDPDTGTVNVTALADSYRALEQRLSRGGALPDTESPGSSADAQELEDPEIDFLDDIDVDGDDLDFEDDFPASAEDYSIAISHPWMTADSEVNDLLHAAGFTQAQAQLVYDLAAEKVVPLLEEAVSRSGHNADMRARQAQLAQAFGGTDAFEAEAADVDAWARTHLPEHLYQSLATSPDGVIALRHMMKKGEPALLSPAAGGHGPDEAALRRLMDDPRYWRDHDAAIVQQVQEGFRRLYPD